MSCLRGVDTLLLPHASGDVTLLISYAIAAQRSRQDTFIGPIRYDIAIDVVD